MHVVVTGMGVVSPIGTGVEQFWSAAIKGVSGIDKIQSFDSSKLSSKIAGEVKQFDPKEFLTPKYIDQMDRFTQFALHAANQAIEDAGGLDCYSPHRIAVVLGSGMGGFSTFESSALRRFQDRSIPPFTVPRIMANSAGAWIATKYGFKGVNLTCSTACSSGANAIGMGLDLLRSGRADTVIVGGAEACVLPLTMKGFEVLHALSTGFNDQPQYASRPFANGRDGFIMGEGAGVLVLEEQSNAEGRGAKTYAKLAGYGCACDATHIVAPDMVGQVAAMQTALQDASVKPDSVDYINAHATSTPLGDIIETRAIKHLFAEHASRLSISATKSMIGHSIGASAAIGAIATIQTLRTQMIHPTINLVEPDPDCDLDYTANQAVERKVDTAMCNAFGFGGNNVSIVFTNL
ncbi:3-oxoacyl-[acyl-carrier-protein] synthase II [Nitrosomonas sp. PY1]|uniref:beta-ketoacyl-ACP synthase II n=1 Tax=Nitrosomonas sp. PY1 TaxID=1803906 RepID=UPI001FC83369|nr:beta-ketoacyl-ACP synthase II [Nitrosomonas sp. PY1]GKS69900.1 3-oxoacyl-[acyl-carrier-protein] synthase II [Nitrosomonas sp. PY1]